MGKAPQEVSPQTQRSKASSLGGLDVLSFVDAFSLVRRSRTRRTRVLELLYLLGIQSYCLRRYDWTLQTYSNLQNRVEHITVPDKVLGSL